MKKAKKFLSMVLVVLMLVSVVPIMYAHAASQIPLDAVEFNGHYYKVYYDATIGWHDAKTACEELGGHLATITTQEEDSFIYSLVSEKNIECWLGGTDENTEGIWTWITGEIWSYDNGEFNNDEDDQHYLVINYEGSRTWDDQSEKYSPKAELLCKTKGYVCEWEDIYNLGEETYNFANFTDNDSTGGHCFGMSVTSSGYYLGILDPTNVGASSSQEIYNLSDNATVREPICRYQAIQGSIRNKSMLAGGTNYKDSDKFDIATDWDEVIKYVRSHEYDNKGCLQIGYRKSGEGGHAINFLRYEVVDGQERIYAYDNNEPETETYFYQDDNGDVIQAVNPIFSGSIDCITLRYVPTYFSMISEEILKHIIKYAVYAFSGNIYITRALSYIMDMESADGEYYMYEIPEDITTVKITPLVNNATFTYMGQEYSFGEIDEDTYAEFTLSTSEDDIPEFKIINAPEEPIDDCSCNCHASGIRKLIFVIINFFQKLFGQNKVCKCGAAH